MVIDSATGARCRLPVPALSWWPTGAPGFPGSISPDGSTAAVFRSDGADRLILGTDRLTLHLIDLTSGADHQLPVGDYPDPRRWHGHPTAGGCSWLARRRAARNCLLSTPAPGTSAASEPLSRRSAPWPSKAHPAHRQARRWLPHRRAHIAGTFIAPATARGAAGPSHPSPTDQATIPEPSAPKISTRPRRPVAAWVCRLCPEATRSPGCEGHQGGHRPGGGRTGAARAAHSRGQIAAEAFDIGTAPAPAAKRLPRPGPAGPHARHAAPRRPDAPDRQTGPGTQPFGPRHITTDPRLVGAGSDEIGEAIATAAIGTACP